MTGLHARMLNCQLEWDHHRGISEEAFSHSGSKRNLRRSSADWVINWVITKMVVWKCQSFLYFLNERFSPKRQVSQLISCLLIGLLYWKHTVLSGLRFQNKIRTKGKPCAIPRTFGIIEMGFFLIICLNVAEIRGYYHHGVQEAAGSNPVTRTITVPWFW